MHPSSLENMQKCYERYICNDIWRQKTAISVIDIGGANINGSYRDIFSNQRFIYKAVDLEENVGVDIVLNEPYSLPFKDNSIDIVLCGQVFEHVEYFWDLFSEIIRILKSDGIFFLIAPSAGPIHKFPVDCFRYNPDAYVGLAKRENCFLIDCWRDERGPWKELVGVFSKTKISKFQYKPGDKYDEFWINDYKRDLLPIFEVEQTIQDKETIKGSFFYLNVLKYLHKVIKPKFYIEIGVKKGDSFKLSQSLSYGIDPEPEIDNNLLNKNKILFRMTSDDFFEFFAQDVLKNKKIDLAFIDGMHLFEFVLRDFINIEKYSNKNTIVLIDDIFPNNPIQAGQKRQTKVWMGDVWKILYCLKKYRKDLDFLLLDTKPGGLLIIKGLDPKNTILVNKYNTIVNEFNNSNNKQLDECLKAQLERKDAISKDHPKAFFNFINSENINIDKKTKPLISVVVVAYNMNRELPRTLYTMRDIYQKGIKDEHIEIIVVDNGSKSLYEIPPNYTNVRQIVINNPSKSPAHALNVGIEHASADFICTMIDGARMLSPGIFHYALKAKKMYPRVIVSTLGFHLGKEVQPQSVLKGYNALQENLLLDSVNWQKNGYRLFSISTFAGSSQEGWFSPISESNALFMTRDLWKELNGFDEQFVSPGGGLLNSDTYARACDLPDTPLVTLLGEGTFHQIHGGIATNNINLDSILKKFRNEYRSIRGKDYTRPQKKPILLGKLNNNL
ncbi:MAG: methyltransferase domain-containing protein [Firmicutes bacterium]|nr:methyltransferase domain-containing protein [Bacillota bacterium]